MKSHKRMGTTDQKIPRPFQIGVWYTLTHDRSNGHLFDLSTIEPGVFLRFLYGPLYGYRKARRIFSIVPAHSIGNVGRYSYSIRFHISHLLSVKVLIRGSFPSILNYIPCFFRECLRTVLRNPTLSGVRKNLVKPLFSVSCVGRRNIVVNNFLQS